MGVISPHITESDDCGVGVGRRIGAMVLLASQAANIGPISVAAVLTPMVTAITSGPVVSFARPFRGSDRHVAIVSSAAGLVIGTLGDHLSVVHPYPVTISDADQDGVFVAIDAISNIFGEGTSPAAAYIDYKQSLVETIQFLEDNETDLGPTLKAELSRLRLHVQRV